MKIKAETWEMLAIVAVVAAVVGIRACTSGGKSVEAAPAIEVVRADSAATDSVKTSGKKADKKPRHQPVARDFLDEKIERD